MDANADDDVVAVERSSAVRNFCKAIPSMIRTGTDWRVEVNRHVRFHHVLAVTCSVADARTVTPTGSVPSPEAQAQRCLMRRAIVPTAGPHGHHHCLVP